jgi:hypothetical protein
MLPAAPVTATRIGFFVVMELSRGCSAEFAGGLDPQKRSGKAK